MTPHGCPSCEYRRNVASRIALVVIVLILLPLSFALGWPVPARVMLVLILPISVASLVVSRSEHSKHVEAIERRMKEETESEHGDAS